MSKSVLKFGAVRSTLRSDPGSVWSSVKSSERSRGKGRGNGRRPRRVRRRRGFLLPTGGRIWGGGRLLPHIFFDILALKHLFWCIVSCIINRHKIRQWNYRNYVQSHCRQINETKSRKFTIYQVNEEITPLRILLIFQQSVQIFS